MFAVEQAEQKQNKTGSSFRKTDVQIWWKNAKQSHPAPTKLTNKTNQAKSLLELPLQNLQNISGARGCGAGRTKTKQNW
jgi:hypothetical protein